MSSISDRASRLVRAIQDLSLARSMSAIQRIVRIAARDIAVSDGATFVLRDEGQCYYADEDAIAPLWKGRRFPLEACISGWSMIHRTSVVIPDIYVDDRIPHDAYRPTFVKSLLMTPIRTIDPVGAVGVYWAEPHEATEAEVRLLAALADSTAVAIENVASAEALERHRAKSEELEQQAVTDELTGLANRRGFMMLSRHRLEHVRRHLEPAVVFFADLDGLKAVNDSRGHEAGDRLIRRMAAALLNAFRSEDVVARLAGDEFVAFASGFGLDPDAIIVRLREEMQALSAVDNDGHLSASIGWTAYNPGDEIEDMVARADASMYRDKLARRSRTGA